MACSDDEGEGTRGVVGNTKPKGKKLEGVEWADLGTLGSRVMGGTDTIAQVSESPSVISHAIHDVFIVYIVLIRRALPLC